MGRTRSRPLVGQRDTTESSDATLRVLRGRTLGLRSTQAQVLVNAETRHLKPCMQAFAVEAEVETTIL